MSVIGSIAIGITKSQIKRVVINKAVTAIAKQQVKSKATKKIVKGTYKVYKSTKTDKTYNIKNLYRDSRSVKKVSDLAGSRNTTSTVRNAYKIIKDIKNRVNSQKIGIKFKETIEKIQNDYRGNIFDKVLLDLSQKYDGAFTEASLKDSAKEYFNKLFEDKIVAENFTKAFHEFVDKRVDFLEKVGMLNKRADSNIFEITDIYFDRLEKLELINKDIPKELKFKFAELNLINDSIKSDGINLDELLEKLKVTPGVEDPEHQLKMTKGLLEKLARYNYLTKSEEDEKTSYKVTEKGVSELYMYRDLDKLEKSIYSFLKDHEGVFNRDEYTNYLKTDKKLLSEIQKLTPMERIQFNKEFVFGKYDANYLFKEYFEDGKLNTEELLNKIDDKFDDPKDASKEYDVVSRRLNKLYENDYLDYDEENKIYLINEKGFEEAERVSKVFTFTSYDANVVFGYIPDEKGLSMTDLKEQLKEEYKNTNQLEKQFEYLQSRFNKNVENGYLDKTDDGKYIITEKGQEQLKLFSGELEKKISDKLEFLSRAGLIDNEHNKLDLFEKVYECRLNAFDQLIYNAAKTNNSSFTKEILIENATLHYMHNQGATKACDDKLKEFEEHIKSRFSTLEKLMFIHKNDDDSYETTDKFDNAMEKQGEFREKFYKPGSIDELSKFHMYLLNKSTSKEGIITDSLLNEYQAEGLDNFEDKYKISIKVLDKLTANDYMTYNSNGSYNITKKGVQALYKNRNLNSMEKYIFENNLANGYIDIDKLIKTVFEDEKLLKYIKRDIPAPEPKQFSFSKYDANVIFKEFDSEMNNLTLENLKEQLKERFSDSEEAEQQFKIMSKRLEKLLSNNYIDYNESEMEYSINEKGIQAAKDINKQFVFTSYDVNVVFKYIENNGGSISSNKLYEVLKTQYTDVDFIENQHSYLLRRFNKNVKAGYLEIDADENYSLSNKGIEERDSSLKIYQDYVNKYIDNLKNIGLIESINETYITTNLFTDIVNNKELEVAEKILDNFKFTSFDQRILNTANDNLINLEERKNIFETKYKNNTPEAERQFKMFTERCKKLESAGYLEKTDEGYKIIKQPEKSNNVKSKTEKTPQMETLETIKITKFDLNNITEILKNNIWSAEAYRSKFTDLDNELLDKKVESTIKRLNSLELYELAAPIGDNKWIVKDMFIERSRSRANELTKEQIKILDSLKDFMNCTQEQFTSFIYDGNSNIAKSDLNSLVNRGYINVDSRDFENDGNYTKVYYLNTKGKKEITKLFDVKMENIYDSKIHSRPEELHHDLLVYSAFNDVKESLENDNFKIRTVMTDKQMRAYDMKNNHKMRKDYSDLYVEFEDKNNGDIGYLNIEVDVGYSPKVIAEKASNIDNLVWYTNSSSQADRIKTYSNNSNIKIINIKN